MIAPLRNLRLLVLLAALACSYFSCAPLAVTGEGSQSASSSTAGEPTALDIEWQSSPVPVLRGDPIHGEPGAPVTIVEFGDLQCHFCARANVTLRALAKQYGPSQVRFVWKHYPLPFHKQARPAHQAAAAVHALGGNFWTFHDLAYANQNELTQENFRLWAVASGVKEELFREKFGEQEYENTVDEDIALARKLSVDGTPHYFVNGLRLSGARPAEDFARLIDAQLAAAERMVTAGVAPERVSLQLTLNNYRPPESAAAPAADTRAWRIPVHSDDPTRGPADALITIVEWSDFQCPFCARAQGTLEKLLAAHPNDIRLVWKDSPLPFHDRAVPAALTARFAYQQGGNAAFWAVHDKLFAHQDQLDNQALQALLKEQGLDWDQAQTAFASQDLSGKIRRSLEEAEDFEARGTPHFFINGRRLVGAQPLEAFEALVNDELTTVRQWVADGLPRAEVYARVMREAQPAPLPERKDIPPAGAQHASKGPTSARIVIQEFSDFQCPYCRRVNPTIAELRKRYPNDIRVVWRHLPLPFHAHAQLAAEASQEAFAQGGSTAFWKFHDLLFAHQDALTRPELEQYARDIGLDVVRFAQALDQHTHLAHIQADTELARKAGVSGTPAFVINGFFLGGAQPYQRFDRIVRRLLTPPE